MPTPLKYNPAYHDDWAWSLAIKGATDQDIAMLEAARLAPSSTNSQPWRFVVYENRIHVFSKKPLDEKSLLNPFTELNFGIMLANVMVAAEEVWVDLDLIKLNNITHKSIPNNQYVISILLKP